MYMILLFLQICDRIEKRKVIFVTERRQSLPFQWQYYETNIESRVLWESHCHAQFEMLCVLEGDISILLEGRRYRLTERQTVVIPPLCYHTISANKRGSYRRITILFDPDAIPHELRPHFLKKDERLTIFPSPRAEELGEICREENQELYAPLTQSIVIQLLYDDLRAERGNATEIDESLQIILRYIDGHLGKKLTLSDLAACAACSESTVSHLFAEKMKISPKQYILQKKMALAEQLIRTGSPATLAAMQVGYDNYSNFFRMYRKHVGTPPTKKDKNRKIG